jgi:hypothetical protein
VTASTPHVKMQVKCMNAVRNPVVNAPDEFVHCDFEGERPADGICPRCCKMGHLAPLISVPAAAK